MTDDSQGDSGKPISSPATTVTGSIDMATDNRTIALVKELVSLPAETAWLEFKENNTDAMAMGVRISALANAARMLDKHFAYMLWGIRDLDHQIVGTTFEPSSAKRDQQPLEFWLAQRLTPSISISFKTIMIENSRVILLEIPAATSTPIEFISKAYIRVGSATPALSDYPERQKVLWAKLQPYAWESGVAAQYITSDDVLNWIDYTSYFELTRQPLPDNRKGIFERLATDKIIASDVGGRWNITNLGAMLFAKKLTNFDLRLSRKAVRLVQYDGSSRTHSVKNRLDGQRGYAAGFERLIEYIDTLLPRNEHIGTAFRAESALFPPIAIRELIANALIHQDMTISGTSPLIEVFKDRIEITNPGTPLVSLERLIDSPPRSRNEAIAALMRRMRLCEEQGTGIDKVIMAVELYQLPPPDFRAEANAMRVVLFAPRSFSQMTREERSRACYQHAVLKYLSGERMSNASLRSRFGIESRNAAQVSVVIKGAVDAELIKPADPDKPRAAYFPIWA